MGVGGGGGGWGGLGWIGKQVVVLIVEIVWSVRKEGEWACGGGGEGRGGWWECGLKVEQGQDGRMKCCFSGGSCNASLFLLYLPLISTTYYRIVLSNEKIRSSSSKNGKERKTEAGEGLHCTLTLSRRKLVGKKERKKKACRRFSTRDLAVNGWLAGASAREFGRLPVFHKRRRGGERVKEWSLLPARPLLPYLCPKLKGQEQ